MPFYEYECLGCGDRFTRQQHMSDPPVAECPACHGRVRKVFHAPGVSVKSAGTCAPTGAACSTGGG